MLPLCCFVNGVHVRTRVCTTPTEILGIACYSKASSFWIDSARTTAFAFFSPAVICRSSSRDAWRCQSCGTMSNLEVHHKEFRSQSGHDREENLITLCTTC